MPRYIYGDESFIPQSILAQYEGLKPSYERLRSLIDDDDLALPAITAVLCEMNDAGVELDETSIALAIKLGRRRWDKAAAAAGHGKVRDLLTLASAASSIVYYIKRGALIKIGTTDDPVGRFTVLLPDAILAAEPGARPAEKLRHRQFAHLRCQGEHFQPALELLAHIEVVRGMYGNPDPSWPTSATAAAPCAGRVPGPVSAELMTVKEAYEVLGVTSSTIRTWVERGQLKRVGRAGRGYVYYADDLKSLQARSLKKAVA